MGIGRFNRLRGKGMTPFAMSDSSVDGVVSGALYECVQSFDAECVGHMYEAVAVCVDLGAYQRKVLLEGVDGKDDGKLYTCSLEYFKSRFVFVRMVETADAPVAETMEAGSGA